MEIPSKRLKEKYGASGAAALKGAAGLDHLDVDMSMNSFSYNGYILTPGEITMRNIYGLCQFDNSIYVLPLYGRDIRSIMEENAKYHLRARRIKGQVHIYAKGSDYTNLSFGGLNFTYDMSKPDGSRVQIDGFSNGRPFEEDALYLVSVNNYVLGNAQCGLRSFSEEDSVWSQVKDDGGGTIQNLVAEYIRDRCEEEGELTPDSIDWHWSVIFPEDPDALSPQNMETAATLSDQLKDGHTYVLYHEPSGYAVTDKVKGKGLDGTQIEAYENILCAPLPENTGLFTAHVSDDGTFLLSDAKGRYLTAVSGGLKLTESPDEKDRSLWKAVPSNSGLNIISAGLSGSKALEYYSDIFVTFSLSGSNAYIFNFYEIPAPAEAGGN